jgi:predicted acetyltransferase
MNKPTKEQEDDFHATHEYEKSWAQPETKAYIKRIAQACLAALRTLNRNCPHKKLDAAIEHINYDLCSREDMGYGEPKDKKPNDK